jgi:hypothetical protein
MRTQLNNHISAAVLEVNGRKIGEREFVNTPFAQLFPKDEFAIIDWLANSTSKLALSGHISTAIKMAVSSMALLVVQYVKGDFRLQSYCIYLRMIIKSVFRHYNGGANRYLYMRHKVARGASLWTS